MTCSTALAWIMQGQTTRASSDGISATSAHHGSHGNWLSSCISAMAFWRPLKKAALDVKRRSMYQSLLQPFLLTWPFLLWGVLIIVCYAIGINQLAAISGPIATFNMVRQLSDTTRYCI
jgi:hypothetical protein